MRKRFRREERRWYATFVQKEPGRIKEPDDWGYNYPRWYVRLSFQLFLMSGFTKLDRAGGIEDQDLLWINDMMLALLLKAYQEQPYSDALSGYFNRKSHG